MYRLCLHPLTDEIAHKASLRLKANFDKFQQLDEEGKDHVDPGEDDEGSEEDQSHLELLTEMHPGKYMLYLDELITPRCFFHRFSYHCCYYQNFISHCPLSILFAVVHCLR